MIKHAYHSRSLNGACTDCGKPKSEHASAGYASAQVPMIEQASARLASAVEELLALCDQIYRQGGVKKCVALTTPGQMARAALDNYRLAVPSVLGEPRWATETNASPQSVTSCLGGHRVGKPESAQQPQDTIDATLAELARRIRRAVGEHNAARKPNFADMFAALADYVESPE